MADHKMEKMLYGGTKTLPQVYYDRLVIPPILSLMTVDDIALLHKYATSARLSGNIRLKESKIDEVMKSRGFVKFAGGTNRVVYTHPLVPTAVYKVAYDAVGLNDNPSEFYNQDYIKPYCCKVFECSPCGTIASFEKLDRITTFQEFYSVAEDIFYIIYRILLGKYVLEDIGIKFFLNWAIRPGFGPCIVDFPYVFELDGDKLICDKTLDDGTKCGGEIDYDDGFNFLHCTKCNTLYRARQLAKLTTESKILRKGRNKMKVKINVKENNTTIDTKYSNVNPDDFFMEKKRNKKNSEAPKSDHPIVKLYEKEAIINKGKKEKKDDGSRVPMRFGTPTVIGESIKITRSINLSKSTTEKQNNPNSVNVVKKTSIDQFNEQHPGKDIDKIMNPVAVEPVKKVVPVGIIKPTVEAPIEPKNEEDAPVAEPEVKEEVNAVPETVEEPKQEEKVEEVPAEEEEATVYSDTDDSNSATLANVIQAAIATISDSDNTEEESTEENTESTPSEEFTEDENTSLSNKEDVIMTSVYALFDRYENHIAFKGGLEELQSEESYDLDTLYIVYDTDEENNEICSLYTYTEDDELRKEISFPADMIVFEDETPEEEEETSDTDDNEDDELVESSITDLSEEEDK